MIVIFLGSKVVMRVNHSVYGIILDLKSNGEVCLNYKGLYLLCIEVFRGNYEEAEEFVSSFSRFYSKLLSRFYDSVSHLLDRCKFVEPNVLRCGNVDYIPFVNRQLKPTVIACEGNACREVGFSAVGKQ